MIKEYKYKKMTKVKMILSWIAIIVICIIFDYKIYSSQNILLIIITGVITLYLTSLNINNYIKIENYGVKEYRKFNSTQIKWESIRRIEYIKLRGGKNACAMKIYGTVDMSNDIYVENDFENYLDIWKCILEECDRRDIKAIIDGKILEKLKS